MSRITCEHPDNFSTIAEVEINGKKEKVSVRVEVVNRFKNNTSGSPLEECLLNNPRLRDVGGKTNAHCYRCKQDVEMDVNVNE